MSASIILISVGDISTVIFPPSAWMTMLISPSYMAIRKVAIAMYEGEINLVIHGGGGEIDVDIDGQRVLMVLTDHGPGIPDICKAMEEGWSTASDSARSLGFGAGMGLPNMKKNTDEMTVESTVGEGTTVTMVVRLGG